MKRREFLRAAGAGAALGLVNRAEGAASGMYISLHNSMVAGKVQWPETARLAAKAGFGGADINLSAAIEEGLGATKALLAELKLRPANCVLPLQVTRDEEAFQKGMEGLEDQVRFAVAIGCPRMVYTAWGSPPATTPKEELRKTLVGRFQAAGGLYISVLTNPTMGGVAASFASLGDITLAEPKALVRVPAPTARRRTDFGAVPEMTKPPIATPLPAELVPRAEMSARVALPVT